MPRIIPQAIQDAEIRITEALTAVLKDFTDSPKAGAAAIASDAEKAPISGEIHHPICSHRLKLPGNQRKRFKLPGPCRGRHLDVCAGTGSIR